MAKLTVKLLKVVLIAAALGGLYLVALSKHAERDRLRDAQVDLTANCEQKLEAYGLAASGEYRSPYLLRTRGSAEARRGYSAEDVRAIQRGCNIVDDLQGRQAKDGPQERWHADRFVRGTYTTCAHCHQGVGDKQDAQGRRPPGSNNLGASWVMADMYDRFTGLLLPHELRQMQCFINSSNGFKPNAADDVLRDITAYSRFLSGVLDMKIGNRYLEQGMQEVPASATNRRGDDYVRGAYIYRQRCAACHGPQALGRIASAEVTYPALAGPNSFSLDSRMNFSFVNTISPGFICRNMPPGQEGSLENQDCRDIAFYLSTLPRPAGDRQGPLVAAWQQMMMRVMPPLTKFAETMGSDGAHPMTEEEVQRDARLPAGMQR